MAIVIYREFFLYSFDLAVQKFFDPPFFENSFSKEIKSLLLLKQFDTTE